MSKVEKLRADLAKAEDQLKLAQEREEAAEHLRRQALIDDEANPAGLVEARRALLDARERHEEAKERVSIKRKALAAEIANEAEEAERAEIKRLERAKAAMRKRVLKLMEDIRPVGEGFAALIRDMEAFRVDTGTSTLGMTWTPTAVARVLGLELHRVSDGQYPNEIPFHENMSLLATVENVADEAFKERVARGARRTGEEDAA